MEPKRIRGILPAIITPFNRDGDVEFEHLRGVVRFHLEKGVHGFFACGSAGEGPLMSIEQRKAVAETVLKEAADRVPVIVHVGTTNTRESIELARHAEAAGATAVGVVTPYYFHPDVEGLIEHYKLIAEAVDIPVLAYNIPIRTGYNMTPEIVRKLCDIPNMIGVKDSSRNLIQIREIIETAPKPITVINGSDNLLFAALMIGVDAQISGIANVVPELLVELYEAYKKGVYEKAVDLQAKINAVKRVLDKPPIAPIKAALEMRGVKAGLPRRPLRPLTLEELTKLEERLKTLNLFW
ncbi:MAG: 4-hydroxy-tetrahydrodipicolinate synthase [Candidatus Bathyarchaeia archaeon]